MNIIKFKEFVKEKNINEESLNYFKNAIMNFTTTIYDDLDLNYKPDFDCEMKYDLKYCYFYSIKSLCNSLNIDIQKFEHFVKYFEVEDSIYLKGYPIKEIIREMYKNFDIYEFIVGIFAINDYFYTENDLDYAYFGYEKHYFSTKLRKEINDVLIKLELLELIDFMSKKNVFIAMKFKNETVEEARNVIKNVIISKNLNPIIMDELEHNEIIMEKLPSMIDDSIFVIADFTLQSPGVYFEAGYALGRDKEVICCVSKNDYDNKKIHFDIKPRNLLVWVNSDDLRENLSTRVESILNNNVMN